jgi:copper binding protein CusF
MRIALKSTFGVVCAGALLLAGACGRTRQGHDYTVRGLLVQPPGSGSGVYLYHQAIDDWVGRDGKVAGMDAMAMQYPVAPGVSLAGFHANDKVEITVHSDWQSDTPVEVIRIRKLPPDTKLVFRAAKPPRNP